ncbi:S-layer homology domain-containing protein [Paenibacillus sp. B01]|uniref:S-layer homology domain-containing protein n=1 Tax=Paenibacillus sp. B01 TaxID=2660554 RepID=UPI00129A2156|nr:S-layer homology domain-containing protein [Paenibacillus sp. B01]QGG57371.1 hypothetical protein GE073_18410 [Paenibacillus sp. B01]
MHNLNKSSKWIRKLNFLIVALLIVNSSLFIAPAHAAVSADSWVQYGWQSPTSSADPGGFYFPAGVAVDTSGNVYVADYGNHRIQKLTVSTNTWSEWGAGNSLSGSGLGQFSGPTGLAVDSAGNVYVADSLNNRVQKLTVSTNTWSEWGKGNGQAGNGLGEFSIPGAVAVDAAGNVYVADYGNNRLQKLTISTNTWSEWGAGNSRDGNGLGEFSGPSGVAADSSGNVYVADTRNHRVQKLSAADGTWSKWGKTGGGEGSGLGEFNSPGGIAVDSDGNMLVADYMNNRIQKLSVEDGTWSKWEKDGGGTGDGLGEFNMPSSVAVDSSGNMYVADLNNNRIQKLSADDSTWSQWRVTTIASSSRLGGFNSPVGVAVDDSGNMYVADLLNSRIQKLTLSTHTWSEWGAGGGATGSGLGEFYAAAGVAVDHNGNVYATDYGNNRVQKLTVATNTWSDWGAGNGQAGSGLGEFSVPIGVTVDGSGNVYVADMENDRIQKLTVSTNTWSEWGKAGGGPGSGLGEFDGPVGVAVDDGGNVYVADVYNNRIQKLDISTNTWSEWGKAGGGAGSGLGEFNGPFGVAVDSNGNIYVADRGNHRIQKLDISTNTWSEWGKAGGGAGKGLGEFDTPNGVTVDRAGNVYVADSNNHRIQKLEAASAASPISDFASTGHTSTTATFGWTGAIGATNVVIEQSAAGANAWTTATTGAIAANATNATVTGLSAATAYDFRLVVTGGSHAGTSNTASVTTDVTTDASPISDFASTGHTSTTATFGWTGAIGATNVVIEQSAAGADAWTTATTGAIAADATNATVTGLSAATAYDFRLVVTGGSHAGTSNTASVTTDASPISDFASTGKTSTTATFGWTEAIGATNVVIEQSAAGANAWTTATTGAIAANATNATVTGLSAATAYDFRLVVTGGSHAGTSNTASVTTDVTTDASPISDFASTGHTSTTATFGWTGAAGATNVVIEQSAAGANAWTTATTGAIAANATNATVTGLSAATAYDFRLVVTGGSHAGTSNTASVTTDVTTDASPISDFASTGHTSTTATFGWTGAIGATNVVIEQSAAGANAWTTATTGAIAANATNATVTGLSAATAYDFRLVVTGGSHAGTSNTASVTTDASAPSTPISSGASYPATEADDSEGFVLINGEAVNVGTLTATDRNGQTVTALSLDYPKMADLLATDGQNAIVTTLFDKHSEVALVELSGQTLKLMQEKHAILVIKTDRATYTLPAQQLNLNNLSNQIGSSIALQDIKMQIEVAESLADTVKVVENAAAKGAFKLVAAPVDFEIRAVYGDTMIPVSKFNAYVERTIAIPDGVDPNNIMTGVAFDRKGAIRHVPTRIVKLDGSYYAKISSLTNSTYSVVWNPVEFDDMANHWAELAVNDMGSRLIIEGTGSGMFNPDREITRAEFAAIIVRALGLELQNSGSPFSDVASSDWYSGVLNTAYSYQLINGIGDGTVHPNDRIKREEAMVMIAKAMKLTGLKDKLPEQAPELLLRPYTDAAVASEWARSSIADCIQSGIVSGRSDALLAPKAFMTRAEVAMIVQRLLQKSELI